MPVHFKNYTYTIRLGGKPGFVPSERGRKIGEDIKDRVKRAYTFDDFYYHMRKGGHVAAIHAHRQNHFFCRLDIKNFFYSVTRNRVVKNLRKIKIPRSEDYGKWSCVRNPYTDTGYALPYGFVQSPILASLFLSMSPLGSMLREVDKHATVSVYVDDLLISANDLDALKNLYWDILGAFKHARLDANEDKCIKPCEALSVFNCSLKNEETLVSTKRREEFHDVHRTSASINGFKKYCDSVKCGNG